MANLDDKYGIDDTANDFGPQEVIPGEQYAWLPKEMYRTIIKQAQKSGDVLAEKEARDLVSADVKAMRTNSKAVREVNRRGGVTKMDEDFNPPDDGEDYDTPYVTTQVDKFGREDYGLLGASDLVMASRMGTKGLRKGLPFKSIAQDGVGGTFVPFDPSYLHGTEFAGDIATQEWPIRNIMGLASSHHADLNVRAALAEDIRRNYLNLGMGHNVEDAFRIGNGPSHKELLNSGLVRYTDHKLEGGPRERLGFVPIEGYGLKTPSLLAPLAYKSGPTMMEALTSPEYTLEKRYGLDRSVSDLHAPRITSSKEALEDMRYGRYVDEKLERLVHGGSYQDKLAQAVKEITRDPQRAPMVMATSEDPVERFAARFFMEHGRIPGETDFLAWNGAE